MSMKGKSLCSGFDFFNMNLTGEVAKSLQAEGGGSGVNEGCVLYTTYDARGNGGGETCNTLTGDHQNRITDYTSIVLENDMENEESTAVDARNGTESPETNGCLQEKSTCGTGENFNNVCRQKSVVRRLTPMECERLQGYPDNHTNIGEWVDRNGKKHKDADSPRYKALGNSIALPFWQWMAARMVYLLKQEGVENPKMASLFDGIGGFPLVYSRCGCSPVWASEVEEFCIAVTKRRFPEDEMEECDNKGI